MQRWQTILETLTLRLNRVHKQRKHEHSVRNFELLQGYPKQIQARNLQLPNTIDISRA